VIVELEVTEPGNVAFVFSYLVDGASWHSKYEFWVDSNHQTVDLMGSALVSNATGENWPEVDMVLSTASPDESAAPPEMKTTYVAFGRGQAYPPSVESYGDTILGGDVPIGVAKTTFELHTHSVIECTGVEHEMATVTLRSIPMKCFYTVAPRISSTAYHMLSAKNASDHILLAGHAAVFIDGSFICQTSLKCLAPGEAFEVCLGTDKDVKIDYTQPRAYDKTKGVLMFKKTEKIFTGSVSVTNGKTDKQITVRVRDQLPLSSDKGIVVQLSKETLTDKNVPKITEEHNLEWKFKLDAEEKVKLTVAFTVTYPEKRDVVFDWQN